MNEELILSIADEFSNLEYVDAVVLSGSRMGLCYSENSDYDIYIYAKSEVSHSFRKNLAKKYASHAETIADYFGWSDEWILKDSDIEFDFIYRSINWANEHIENVWHKHFASSGYTTAFIYNIQHSRILFDRNGDFKKVRESVNTPYPKGLKESILRKNYPLLKDKMIASVYQQIERTVKREDYPNQLNRASQWFSSYFDILFALNEQTHPGESRLKDYALKLCKEIPDNFETDIEKAVKSVGSKDLPNNLNNMLINLNNKFYDQLKNHMRTKDFYLV